MSNDRLQKLLKAQAEQRQASQKQREPVQGPSPEPKPTVSHDQQVDDQYRKMDEETAAILKDMMGTQMGIHMDSSNDGTTQTDMTHGYPNGQLRLTGQIIAKIDDPDYKNDKPSGYLSRNEKLVWSLICELREFSLKTEQISDFTGVPHQTVRKILYRFRDNEFIEMEYNTSAKADRGLRVKKLVTLASELSIPSLNVKKLMDTSSSLVVSQLDNIKTTYTSYEEIKEISDRFIADNYPSLHQVGFGQSQINQCIEAWKEKGLSPDLDTFRLSLTHADWFIENKRPDPKGQPVRDYLAFIFKHIQKGASFRAAGYISPEEEAHIEEQKQQELEDKMSIEDRAEELAAKAEVAFWAWRETLTEDQTQELVEKLKTDYSYSIYKTEEAKLRAHWMINNPEFQPPSE